MNKVFEKIIENLEGKRKTAELLIMENPHDELDRIQTQTAEDFASAYKDAIEIVKQEAEQYEECYKDCGECKAYNKEPPHCPKFCKVIKETVKEIEENRNGWIPCSERLPSGLDFVLYTHKDGEVDICSIEYFYDYLDKFTAWQPLPEPFKERD